MDKINEGFLDDMLKKFKPKKQKMSTYKGMTFKNFIAFGGYGYPSAYVAPVEGGEMGGDASGTGDGGGGGE